MKLTEIMTQEVEVVSPEDTVRVAAQKMRDRNIGFLPVCDGERIVGVISDRDLAVRVIAEGKDPDSTLSRDLLSQPVHFCFTDQEVGDAARIMRDKQIRRLIVIDRETKRLAGVVSLGDIATNAAEQVSGEALQGISLPEGSDKEEIAKSEL
jgi:CBS domain-containing protein